MIGSTQVRAEQLHRRQCLAVAVRVGLGADIGFDGVGQGIDAGVSGDASRYRQGQFIVDQRGSRHEAETNAEHLLVLVGIGNDGETGRFGTGAGGGRDGDDRQALLADIARELVVAHLAAELAQDRDRLGRIDRAAATEGDDRVVIARFDFIHTGQNRGFSGFGQGVGKKVAGNAGFAQCCLQVIHITQLDHHRIGNDQWVAAAQGRQYFRSLATGAGTYFHQAGQNDSVAHCYSPKGSV